MAARKSLEVMRFERYGRRDFPDRRALIRKARRFFVGARRKNRQCDNGISTPGRSKGKGENDDG